MGDRPLSTVDAAVNIGAYVEIRGPLDPVQFQTALRLSVLEAEALRVRFVVDHEGVPAPVVAPPPDWPIRYVDVSGEPDPERAAAEWMADDLATPVRLTRDPLFAHALLTLAPDRYFWLHRCHHMLLDGWGLWLHARRVAEIYTANSTGQRLRPRLPAALDRIEEDAAYRSSARFADDRALLLLGGIPLTPLYLGRLRCDGSGAVREPGLPARELAVTGHA